MLVTLYCDASFCSSTGAGGYGVWLRSDLGHLVRGGRTPGYCAHAYEAELAAIYAGVYLAATQWPDTHRILVRSDCRGALRLMAGQQTPRHDGAIRLHSRILQTARAHRLELVPKWVRGHRKGPHTDAYINRQVDAIARDHMRRYRDRVGTEPAPG